MYLSAHNLAIVSSIPCVLCVFVREEIFAMMKRVKVVLLVGMALLLTLTLE